MLIYIFSGMASKAIEGGFVLEPIFFLKYYSKVTDCTFVAQLIKLVSRRRISRLAY